MRTSIILAAVVLLSACSNDAETTAPRVPANLVTATAVDDVQGGSSAARRPSPAPVVTTVEGGIVTIDPFFSKFGQAFAQCPAGSIVLGGGYQVVNGLATLKISDSYTAGQIAWRIDGWSSAHAQFRAYARCLQQ